MADVCCHDASLALNEPIGGTAKAVVERRIVLQYQGAWERKAYPAAALPTAVRAHIDDAVAALPNTAVQLIRRSRPDPASGLACYLARSADGQLLSYRLNGYDDLLDLDLVGLLSGAIQDEEAVAAPIYLVCVHGERDVCCARWGVPVYKALYQALGECVWQADHVGGHRMAANIVSLPEGLAFGRVNPEHVAQVAASIQDGVIPGLSHYRGRSIYPQGVQAAEWHLLHTLNRRDPLSFRLVTTHIEDDVVTAVFDDTARNKHHTVKVVATPLAEALVMSCGDEPKAASTYVLRSVS